MQPSPQPSPPARPPSATDRLDWQDALFARRLNAFALMKLGVRAVEDAPVLRVHRNHAFEAVAAALPPFLAFAGTPMTVRLGDYDDSLSFTDGGETAAAELVWLDFSRYDQIDDHALADWLTARLDALRQASDAPIVAANAPDDTPRDACINAALAAWAQRTPGAAILDLSALAHGVSVPAIDLARAAVTGTRLSAAFAPHVARALAFQVLPAFFGRPVKAIAIDLDNTLYGGVIGEDGADGVVLTPAHAALQTALAAWAARGVLLAIVSRNEPRDVETLFAQRPDFPLQARHVASWQVGWGAKSEAIEAAAEAFNIAADAFLFIDDNLGELVEVGHGAPGLRLLHANAATAEALDLFPGLPRAGLAFAGRAADLAANEARAAVARRARSPDDYLRELGAILTFALDPAADRARLAELSVKTNQFNLALRRLSEVEVARYLDAADRGAVHVQLSDRLSDSGSVAAVFGHAEDGLLVIDELCISCRALGRRLEDLMVGEAVRRMGQALTCDRVAFAYAEGPRNAPARRWLEAFAGRALPGAEGRLPLAGMPARAEDTPVTLSWTT